MEKAHPTVSAMTSCICISLLIGALAALGAGPKVSGGKAVLSELKRLNIKVVGRPKQRKMELPAALSGPNWGLKKQICEEGGYDLAPYAGRSVLLTSYPIAEKYGDEALDVWIVSSGGRIACVYKAVRESSNMAPGIFPAKTPGR